MCVCDSVKLKRSIASFQLAEERVCPGSPSNCALVSDRGGGVRQKKEPNSDSAITPHIGVCVFRPVPTKSDSVLVLPGYKTN